MKKRMVLALACLLLTGCGGKTAEAPPPPAQREPAVSAEETVKVPPAAAEKTEEPEAPEVPEASETPEMPETLEVPETPEVPKVPEAPEKPEKPEVPETPVAAEEPMVPVAEIEGEALSPDGKYRLAAVGRTEHYVSGVCPPEKLQLVDQAGNVLWEDMGYVRQVVEWSGDSRYAAIYTAARTWGAITVVDVLLGQSVEVKLPDGSSFGEYNFLEQMLWEQRDSYDHKLLFHLNGTEGVKGYSFRPSRWEGILDGDTFYWDTEVLEETWDFNRDGMAETVEIVTVTDPDGETVSWYEVRVVQEGRTLWHQDAALSHAGYNTVLALQAAEGDCLMNYHPYMGTGVGNYAYRIFCLGEGGEEIVAAEKSVGFEMNFHRGKRDGFEPAEIAAFLQEAYAYLEKAGVLFSTEGGEVQREMDGDDFFRANDHLFELPEDPEEWEKHLVKYERKAKKE